MLKLLAQDAEDVPPLSALVQDAVLRAGEVGFDRTAHRLVLLLARYRWEAKDRTRVRSGLRIEAAMSVRRRAWPADPDTMLDLLAVTAADDAITLTFAGGPMLRVAAECIDMLLEDLSEPWPARRQPRHD
jgi:hypothetical protein